MPISVNPNFIAPAQLPAASITQGVDVDPSMMGASAFGAQPSSQPQPLPPPLASGPGIHSTPPGYDASVYTDDSTYTQDTAADQVKDWQLAPDGKSLIGKNGKGETVTTSIAQGQADAAAGRSSIPPELMPKQGGPAGEFAKMAMGAMPPPSQPGAGVDAKAQRDLAAGIDAQKRAIQQGAQVGAQRAAEQAVYQDQLSQHLDTMNAQQAQKQGDQQRFMDGKLRDLQTQMAAVNSAKVDPGHWYASRDTGQKVLAGLGIALGALGQAFTGGPNVALQMVMGAIDRDLDAQKTNLASKREGVAQGMNLIGIYRQKFGDDAMADAAARATMLDAAKMKLQAMASKYDAPEAKAKAAEMLAQLDQEKAKSLQAFGQRTYERSVQGATLGLEAEKLGLAQQQAYAKVGSKYQPALQAISMIENGYKGQNSFDAGVQQYVPGSKAKQYNDLRSAAATQIGEALKGAPLREGEIDYYRDLLPTSGDGKERAAKKIMYLRQLLMAKSGTNLQPSGFAADGQPSEE